MHFKQSSHLRESFLLAARYDVCEVTVVPLQDAADPVKHHFWANAHAGSAAHE